MTDQPPLQFVKLHGCGNSFVVISEDHNSAHDWQNLSAKICSLAFGVGSDGLMVVRRVGQAGIHFDVIMFNPDGSRMGMCGNGIRCVCRFIVMEGLVPPDTHKLTFTVSGREISCELSDQGRWVRVDMGTPRFAPADIPVKSTDELVAAPLEVGGREYKITTVSMGNPHCVVFMPELDSLDILRTGPAFENHALFPDRTNAEFVLCESPERLRVEVWERGAGRTLACGTGACAAVAAGVRQGFCSRKAAVVLPGGTVQVEWEESSDRIFLHGPAEEIARGSIFPHQL